MHEVDADLEAPLLPDRDCIEGDVVSGASGGLLRRAATSALPWSSHSRPPALSRRWSSTLFRPLHPTASPSWGWLDWARFLLVKHSLDALLISVVVLCTVQRDVVHAGYLALALLFFRKASLSVWKEFVA